MRKALWRRKESEVSLEESRGFETWWEQTYMHARHRMSPRKRQRETELDVQWAAWMQSRQRLHILVAGRGPRTANPTWLLNPLFSSGFQTPTSTYPLDVPTWTTHQTLSVHSSRLTFPTPQRASFQPPIFPILNLQPVVRTRNLGVISTYSPPSLPPPLRSSIPGGPQGLTILSWASPDSYPCTLALTPRISGSLVKLVNYAVWTLVYYLRDLRQVT